MKAPDIAALIRDGVGVTPAKSWPTHDGKNLNRYDYVTASEAGRCIRRIYFSKNLTRYGVTLPDVYVENKGWGFFERGHNVEAWAVEKIFMGLNLAKYADLEVTNLGDDQVSYHYGFQAGTPDALVHLDGYTWVGDVKSIDPRTNTAFLPKPENVDQVHQNIDLVRKTTDYNVVGGFLLYINASNYEIIEQKDVPLDEVKMAKLENRARQVMTATDAAVMNPEGLWMEDGCKYCEFTRLCNKVGQPDHAEEHHDIIADAEEAMKGLFDGK